jgi:hypothetical protein
VGIVLLSPVSHLLNWTYNQKCETILIGKECQQEAGNRQTTRKAQQAMTEHQEQSASPTNGVARISRIRKIFLAMTSFTRFVLCVGVISGIVVLRVAGIITIPWWLVVPAVLVGLALVVAFMSAVESVGNTVLDAGTKYLDGKIRR